jgi:iron complex transport system permease protein
MNIMKWLLLLFLLLLLMFAEILTGSANIALSESFDFFLGKSENTKTAVILLEYRLPKMLTALLAGIGLAVSGLLMQTVFRNPLAGPYILGVSSGAALGVMLLMVFRSQYYISGAETALSAFAGAGVTLMLVLLASFKLRESGALLIAGMMVGSAAGGLTSILSYFGTAEQVKSLTVWSFGSLGSADGEGILLMFLACGFGIFLAFLEQKAMNLMLLGDDYAKSLGINPKKTRFLLLIGTALMSGSITAFCGPIGFVGLMTPHLARMIFKTSNHAVLLPACLLLGAIILLFCDVASRLPDSFVLPINAVTALLGAPFVLKLLLDKP